jgi:hypothetical protein
VIFVPIVNSRRGYYGLGCVLTDTLQGVDWYMKQRG